MKRCIKCKGPLPSKGAFLVFDEDLIDGIGLVIIKADKLGPDAAGKHICGKRCLIGFINERLDRLTGAKNMFMGAVG